LKKYNKSKCDADRVKPALINKCEEWEYCSRKDPFLLISTSKVFVELVAEIYESFINKLSTKSLLSIFGIAIL